MDAEHEHFPVKLLLSWASVALPAAAFAILPSLGVLLAKAGQGHVTVMVHKSFANHSRQPAAMAADRFGATLASLAMFCLVTRLKKDGLCESTYGQAWHAQPLQFLYV